MLRSKTLVLFLALSLFAATALPMLAGPTHESPESPTIAQVALSWLSQWIALPGMVEPESHPPEIKKAASGNSNGVDNDSGDAGPQTLTSDEDDSSPGDESGVIVPPGG